MSLLKAMDTIIQKVDTPPEAKPQETPKEPVKETKVETKPDIPIEEVESEDEILDQPDDPVIKETRASLSSPKEISKDSLGKYMVEVTEDGVVSKKSIEQLVKESQKSTVSARRFEEAAKIQKENQVFQEEVNQFFDLMNKSPIVAMYQVLGEDRMNQEMSKYHQEMLAYQNMTPEQKENFELRRKLEGKSTVENFEKEKQSEVLSNQKAQSIKEDLSPKFEAVSAAFKFTTNEQKLRLLNKMKAALSNRPEHSSLEQSEIEMLAEQVVEDQKSEFSTTANQLDGQELLDHLGDAVVEKVRKLLVAKFKTQKAQKVEPSESTKKVATDKKSINSYRDFFKNPAAF